MYLISLLGLQPYFTEIAMTEAAFNGITNAKELATIKANAYPHFFAYYGSFVCY
jgi:SSS family solute:Na+ symporter